MLFTSSSEDQARLDVEQEQAQLQEALMPWISAGKVQLQMPEDGRFSSFQQQLDYFAPHLVFLSGHGRFYQQLFHAHLDEDYAVFCFEAETGTGSHEVKGEDLATVLSAQQYNVWFYRPVNRVKMRLINSVRA